MTKHAIRRLEERYHMRIEEFIKLYRNAIKNKEFFKISQDSFYKSYSSISIVFKIGENKICAISIDDKKGEIITILKLHSYHTKEAIKRGLIKNV